MPIKAHKKRKLLFGQLLLVLFIAAGCLQAQAQNSNIWGNANLTIGEPLYNARTWGRPPSEQALTSMRNINNTNSQSSNSQRRRYRNSSGNLLLTDNQGDIVYDVQGQPIVDSLGGGGGQAPTEMSADADGLPPPPEDPIDAPIDGGLGILLAIGLVVGYKESRLKNTKLKKSKC